MKYFLSSIAAGLIAFIPGIITLKFYSAACEVLPEINTSSELFVAVVCWLVVLFLGTLTLGCFFAAFAMLVELADDTQCACDHELKEVSIEADNMLPWPYCATIERGCDGAFNIFVTHFHRGGYYSDTFYSHYGLETTVLSAKKHFENPDSYISTAYASTGPVEKKPCGCKDKKKAKKSKKKNKKG